MTVCDNAKESCPVFPAAKETLHWPFEDPADAGTIFFDNFNDGSVVNEVPVDNEGRPVVWIPKPDLPGGDYDASSGDFVFTTTEESVGTMVSRVLDVRLDNLSIRSQMRNDSGNAGMIIRNQTSVGNGQNYFAGIQNSPNFSDTVVFLGRGNPDGSNRIFQGPAVPNPAVGAKNDMILQLDAFGDKLDLWFWPPGDPMPEDPQISVTDNTYSGGTIRLFSSDGPDDNGVATFRYVWVADEHIVPEPSSLLLSLLGVCAVGCAARRMKRGGWCR